MSLPPSSRIRERRFDHGPEFEIEPPGAAGISLGQTMKVMAFAISVVCFVSLLGCDRGETHVVSVDSDHAVLEAAVVSFVDFGDASDDYVLDERPTLWRWLEIGEPDLEGLRARLHEIDELDHELVDRFISANESPAAFDQAQFPEGSRLATFSQEARQRIFAQEGRGWPVFEREFGTRGIVYLSRPGYSPDRRSVLIAIWHQRHSEWQRGILLVGEQVAGRWDFREVESTGA